PVAPARVPRWALPLLAALALAGVGLAGWRLAGRQALPRITIGRAEAIARAQAALAGRGVVLPAGWRWHAEVLAPDGEAVDFAWRAGGREAVQALIGTHLPAPRWVVRAATWRGPVADRAEEWYVAVGGDGTVRRVRHVLPEARPGAALDEPAARAAAWRALAPLGITEGRWVAVTVEPTRHPARTDWDVTVRDTVATGLPGGERRARVRLAGDEVADVERFLFVPEAWRREEEREATAVQLLGVALAIITFSLVGVALVRGVVAWGRGALAPGRHMVAALVVGGTSTLAALNGVPALPARFVTSQPFTLQAATAAAAGTVGIVLGAGALLVLLTWALRALATQPRTRLPPWWGVLAACALLASRQVGDLTRLGRTPGFGGWGALDAAVPFLEPLLSALAALGTTVLPPLAALALAALALPRGPWRGAAPILALGFASGATVGLEPTTDWLVSGAAGVLCWLAVWATTLRVDPTLLPLISAVQVAYRALATAVLDRVPGALPAGLVAAVGVLALGGLAVRWLRGRLDAEVAAA
ncbi:MAG: hypothetical protein NW201_11200, partial [Gemmatimonadales bacterium]|nr:hypothetical protein [Gemmatimonadales bacterium]